MLRLSIYHLPVRIRQLRWSSNILPPLNKDTTAKVDFTVTERVISNVGQLNLLVPENLMIVPTRFTSDSIERKYLKNNLAVAGNGSLKVTWQLPETVLNNMENNNEKLLIGIYSYGSSTLWSHRLVDKSHNRRITIGTDGEKLISGHVFTFAPCVTGDYVSRLCSAQREYYVERRDGNRIPGGVEQDEVHRIRVIRTLVKEQRVYGTSNKFYVRSNFMQELNLCVSQFSTESFHFTLTKLIQLFESIQHERRFDAVLKGFDDKRVNSMETEDNVLDSDGQQHGMNNSVVNLEELTEPQKLTFIRGLLLKVVDFVLKSAQKSIQCEFSWEGESQETLDTFTGAEVQPNLHKLCDLLINSVIIKEVLGSSQLAVHTPIDTDVTSSNGNTQRVDLQSIVKKLTSDGSTPIQKDVLKELPAVLHPQKTTIVSGTALLEQLEHLHSSYVPTLNQFLPLSMNYRCDQFLNLFGFVPDKYKTNKSTLADVASKMSTTVRALLWELKTPDEEYEQRIAYVNSLATTLKYTSAGLKLPQDMKFNLFGSSANGFGVIGSDLDIELCLPERSRVEAVKLIVRALKELSMSNVWSVPKARVPIASFEDKKTGYKCDIALTNSSLNVTNTKLLRTYALIDPRVQELGLLVKHWAKAVKINKPSDGTLSSYCLILMVIQFLQNLDIPLVPNLQKLPKDWDGRKTFRDRLKVEGTELIDPITQVNIYIYDPETEDQKNLLKAFAARNKQSTEELLLLFFTYYGSQFNYRDEVISVRRGQPATREDKSEESDWKPRRYLSVEDPFDFKYDTCHYVKLCHQKIVTQFVRGAALVNRLQGSADLEHVYNPLLVDKLPSTVTPENFFKVLCEGSK